MSMATETLTGFGLKDARSGRECRLALQELWLTGRILPAGARLMVRHAFRSAEESPLEVIYSFALPRDAALRRFRISGQGFSVRSELRPVKQAEKDYEAGIQRGNLSAMTRVYQDGVVNLNVGNIAPGEDVTVWLELVAGVELRDDGFRFRFPFTLAPTYHAQARSGLNEDGVGETELPEEFEGVILPNWARSGEGLHRVGFDLEVCQPGGWDEIASPSHRLCVRTAGEGRARVLLAAGGDLPNRDLVLDVQGRQAGAQILSGLDGAGLARLAAVIPSSEFGALARAPRRIVFALDRSGSMGGAPIEQARRSLAACLAVLEEQDEFGIVAFDNTMEKLGPRLRPGRDEDRRAARTFLDKIDARGGTELLAALREACKLLGKAGGDVLLLTDGQVSGADAIIAEARKGGVRVHCLGIGSASQDRFLSLLARETGGVSRFLTPRERVDLAALELFQAIGRPVASEVKFTLEGFKGGAIAPAGPSTVFSGTPVLLFANAREAGPGRLVAIWQAGDRPCRREFEVTVDPGRLGETLKLLQGARLITEVELQGGDSTGRPGILARRRTERMNRQLEELSRQFGLASRAMALVAVLEREADQPGRLPETRVVAVAMPEDTGFDSYFGGPRFAHSVSFAPRAMFSMSAAPAPPEADELEASAPPPAMSAQPYFSAVAEPVQAEPLSPEDTLMELAGRMQGDGGLPGGDPRERLIRTLAAVLCFLAQGHAPGQGAFGRHLERMVKFLKGCAIPSAAPGAEGFGRLGELRDKVLALAKGRQTPAGDWPGLAHGILFENVAPEQAYSQLLVLLK